jgi:cell filamentation protein
VYEAHDDPYCYPGTAVLRNRFDIRDKETLEALETELTSARAEEPLPIGALNAAHYKAIHHHLFQDVYEWAGVIRTIRISKGDSHFCYPEYIDAELTKLFKWMAASDYLCGLDVDGFVEKGASLLATLNVIHAFREGNGRTQLSFLLLVADNAGHPLDFANLDPAAMLSAMIKSFFGNEAPLMEILRSCIR